MWMPSECQLRLRSDICMLQLNWWSPVSGNAKTHWMKLLSVFQVTLGKNKYIWQETIMLQVTTVIFQYRGSIGNYNAFSSKVMGSRPMWSEEPNKWSTFSVFQVTDCSQGREQSRRPASDLGLQGREPCTLTLTPNSQTHWYGRRSSYSMVVSRDVLIPPFSDYEYSVYLLIQSTDTNT